MARAGISVVSMQEVRLSATTACCNTKAVMSSHKADKDATGVVRATTGALRMTVSAGMVGTGAGRLSLPKVVE